MRLRERCEKSLLEGAEVLGLTGLVVEDDVAGFWGGPDEDWLVLVWVRVG